MLQPAYLARNASERALLSLDQKLTQYQEENPYSVSFVLELSDTITKEDMKCIALHFADVGYDVTSVVSGNNLIIDWRYAQEGFTGKVDIHTDVLNFVRSALSHENEE